MSRLSPAQAEALRSHGEGHPKVGTMKALARAGLVEDRGSRIGCRMWDCYPLTAEGKRVRTLLGRIPDELVLRDALWIPTCGHGEVDVRLVAWDTYDYASDTGVTLSCIHCAVEGQRVLAPF